MHFFVKKPACNILKHVLLLETVFKSNHMIFGEDPDMRNICGTPDIPDSYKRCVKSEKDFSKHQTYNAILLHK